jgi:hypothetical protein
MIGPAAAWLRLRVHLSLLLALGLVGVSCTDDLSHGPTGEPVALALSATVTGLNAAVTYTVDVQVGYQITDGTSRPLQVSNSNFQITSGVEAVPHPVTVVLTPCLNDASRVEAESGGCRLLVTLLLSDDSGELAQGSQDLGVVREGDQRSTPPIAITPNYRLAISGGGEGSGSGMITVPSAGEQPALSCRITDGQAASDGCIGRYPLHTAVVLTAVEGTLEAWADDCGLVGSDAPCQLTVTTHRVVGARFRALPTTGELEVQVAGLPAGAPARVRVTNATGLDQLVTESAVLSGLTPGTYEVTAEAVVAASDGLTYTPAPAAQTVIVSVGERATVQIGYNPPNTGSLAVSVTGLPEGSAAAVTVTGPGNFTQQLTTGQTLSGLLPGSYTVAASNVETPDQIYTPTPLIQTRTVVAGDAVEAAVTYAPARVSLTVVMSGLPSGVDGNVTVTGPNRFRRDLTGSTAPPLVKLAPGSYTVTARSVTADRRVLDPTVAPDQPVIISAGGSVTVTVTYAPPAAAALVFVQQPEPAVIGEVITPPVTVEVRDAQNRPVTGYTTEVTLELIQGDPDEPPGTLGGTARVIPQNGVAVFSDLTIDRPQHAYTLRAISGTLAPATSEEFFVSTGTPVITSIEFPGTVSNGPGTTVGAHVGFSDPGRDISRLLVVEIADPAGTFTPRNFDVSAPDEGPDIVTVDLWTCSATSKGCKPGRVTLSLSLVDLEGTRGPATQVSFDVVGSPPVVDSVHFSPTIPTTPGSTGEFVVFFRDADADITRFREVVVSGPGSPDAFDPQVNGIQKGQFTFFRTCPSGCSAGDITLDLILEDFAGNSSIPFRITYTRVNVITQPPSGLAAKAVRTFPSMDEGGQR